MGLFKRIEPKNKVSKGCHAGGCQVCWAATFTNGAGPPGGMRWSKISLETVWIKNGGRAANFLLLEIEIGKAGASRLNHHECTLQAPLSQFYYLLFHFILKLPR